MNPSQGDDSIYSSVRNKDSFTVAARAKTVSTPHGSQGSSVQTTGSPQVDHWLAMGL